MYLTKLEVNGFRNYNNACISLVNGFNFIMGKNAQGKTNLLEAITICSLGKSFKNTKNDDLVNWASDNYYIRCHFFKNNIDNKIEVFYKKGEKKYIHINGMIISKIGDLFGNLNIVLFVPDDLKILKQGPSERRRFMDIDLIQIKPDYYYNMLQYTRALKQRNNILKKNQTKYLLDIWDDQLIDYGTKIIQSRIDFTNKLSEIIKLLHYKIISKDEKIELKYIPSIDIHGDIKTNYYKSLQKLIDMDYKYRTTTCGPHRDDINILINGHDARFFASQGQQKSIILSLKLSECEIINEEVGDYPVLLLDDVLSELDFDRQKSLLDKINKNQTIITGTYIPETLNYINSAKYVIENGIINKVFS